MTPRQRLKIVMAGGIPDRVPVEPDISNMIPARLTGRPFWDIYVFQNPPLWKAYVAAVKHFGIDGGIEMYHCHPFNPPPHEDWCTRIVDRRKDGSFVTRRFDRRTGRWEAIATLNTADNPPSAATPEKLGLQDCPSAWEDLTGVQEWPTGMELWRLIRKEMGEHAVLGMGSGATTLLLHNPDDIYEYCENPGRFHAVREEMMANIDVIMGKIAAMAPEDKPDFLMCGGSGSLIWQTPAMFRDLCLPLLKKATEMAHDLGIPTHVHSCGPEKELVRMAALETKLSIIDPLEIAPMGDCNLAELKRLYGDKIVLKGNLHTTSVMLRGSPQDVIEASRQAIHDAARGGRFILSTGDQCGRDTPDANIYAMVEAVDRYGKY